MLRQLSTLFFLFSAINFIAPASADDSRSAFESVTKNARMYTLSNGLRVVMYRRGNAPVFAGAVVTRVGGSDEPQGETGRSHMFEHMAFKGTKTVGTRDYSRERTLLARLEEIAIASDSAQNLNADQKKEWGDIMKELQKIWITDDFSQRYEREGASDFNATTDKDFTKYFVSLPRSAFDFWCRMESDRLVAPIMRQFYQERDVVLEERRMRYEDDPMGKLYEMLLGIAYVRHPYRQPVIGYEEDIKALTATDLERFRSRYYVPSNIVIALVGDLDPEKDIHTVERYFGVLPSAPPPSRPKEVEPVQKGERRVTLKAAAAPQFIIAYRKPVYPDRDDAPITVLSEILAGSKISPLYTDLVKRRQLIADIDVDEIPGGAYPNLLAFFASVKSPHAADDVITAFDAVINKFKNTGPTEEQVAVAKRAIGMQHLESLKTNQGLALDFASSELLYGSWKAFADWYDQMMSVSVSDVKRVANQYLNVDQRTVATIERE